MANDLFADIEQLFAEVQQLDQNLTNKYPKIFQQDSAALQSGSAAPVHYASVNASETDYSSSLFPNDDFCETDDIVAYPIDADDLQAYLLRKKISGAFRR